MSIPLLQPLVSNNTKVRQDVWRLKSSEIDFPKLLDSVSKLQTQLQVQKVLLSSEKLLREHPSDKALPNQQATRIKHFVKFVFEENSRETPRKIRLRNLDCSSLKLCGLSYTLREMIELPSQVFEFLVENVADFVQSRELSLLLCRDDINKVVLGDFDPEDEELFKKFLTSHIELRLVQRKHQQGLGSPDLLATRKRLQTSVADSEQEDHELIRPRKRIRSEKFLGEEKVRSGRQIQYMYSNAPIENISLLRDLLPDAIRNSRQWEMERALGESTTDCITTLIPRDPELEISITLWVGQEAGLRMNDKLSLVPKWTSLPNHAEP